MYVFRPKRCKQPLSATVCSQSLVLPPGDNERLAQLRGRCDEHLRQVEAHLSVSIHNRGHVFQIHGNVEAVHSTAKILKVLYDETIEEAPLTPEYVHTFLQNAPTTTAAPMSEDEQKKHAVIRTKKLFVKPRGLNQQLYVERIRTHDINFGIGPAGTGKTYLAVAAGVEAFNQGIFERIVITRPAIEAGERLGFLPGDISQKVDPYLRPIYDALHDMMGSEAVAKMMEKGIIEIAPLAFMRGRTINNAFIVLDESQNATVEQMKMFLTRIGFGSKAVVTGDITQTDLPQDRPSGLAHAVQVLKETDGISFTFFGNRDIVRHALVAQVVEAYEKYGAVQKKIKTE